jgi:ubiquinone/menaquinone biosynthesis C-methylase UbiE
MHYLSHLGRMGSTNLHPLGREGTRRLRSALRIEPGHRILEVGCGTGESLVRFGSIDGVEMHGIDVLPDMLNVARVRLRVAGSKAGLTLADAVQGLPFPDETFDSVYAESVLGIQEPAGAVAFLTEIFRVLKRGGRFVANEGLWKPGTPLHVVEQAHRSGLAQFGFCVASSHGWSLADWRSCMERVGFSIVDAELLQEKERSRKQRWTRALNDLSRPLVLSAIVSGGFRLRGRLIPSLVRDRRRYERAIDSYRVYRPHLEFRLFVLRKPS